MTEARKILKRSAEYTDGGHGCIDGRSRKGMLTWSANSTLILNSKKQSDAADPSGGRIPAPQE
jgi:hypothetical protein